MSNTKLKLIFLYIETLEDDEEEDAKQEVEENVEPEEETKQKQNRRSNSHSPRSATRIPTPVNSTRDKSPRRRSPSPRPTPPNTSVTQMTQQLNSLMGVGVGFGNNLTGSRSSSLHDAPPSHHSPNFHGMNLVSYFTHTLFTVFTNLVTL